MSETLELILYITGAAVVALAFIIVMIAFTLRRKRASSQTPDVARMEREDLQKMAESVVEIIEETAEEPSEELTPEPEILPVFEEVISESEPAMITLEPIETMHNEGQEGVEDGRWKTEDERPEEIPRQNEGVDALADVVAEQNADNRLSIVKTMRLTREDILYYAGEVLPAQFGIKRNSELKKAKGESGVTVARRAKQVLPDVLYVNNRIFALVFDKSRVQKVYLRAGEERAKELISLYGENRSTLPGGFYEWVVGTNVKTKEAVYDELRASCDCAIGLDEPDNELLSSKLGPVLAASLETDAFRKDDAFKAAAKEKRRADRLYELEHCGLLITRGEILGLLDKNAEGEDKRTEANPERPKAHVTASVGKKAYLRLYEKPNRLTLRAYLPYEYAAELNKTHPLIFKPNKTLGWFDAVIDDTYADGGEVYAVARVARKHLVETVITSKEAKKKIANYKLQITNNDENQI